jgi:Dolichyl-phosphate-mannose-protein mannosyltransferase
MSDTAETPSLVRESTFVPFRGWQPWLVLFLLVTSRLLLVVFAHSLSGDDGDRYLTEAINVWTHGTLSMASGDTPSPTAHDLPLFPFIIAGFISVVKVPLLAAKITSLLNCILFGVAARGIYDLGWRLTGSCRTATLAMLIFGCFPESFPYSVFYMPESLFLAFFVWCLVKFVEFLRTDHLRPLMCSFLLWGISILAKPISLFLGPVLALIAITVAFSQRQNRIRRISGITAGLVIGASVVAPWLVRNYVTFGVLGISSITGTNLFYGNYLYMLEDMGVLNAQAVLASKETEVTATISPERDNPMVRANLLGALAKREILAHFSHYVATTLKRHPGLYLGTGSTGTLRLLGDAEGVLAMKKVLADRHAWRKVPLRVLLLLIGSGLILVVVYTSAVVGMMRLGWRRDWIALGVILLALLYFAVLIGPMTFVRYRIAMLPALSVAAAIGLRGGRWRPEAVIARIPVKALEV